jgi:hypothetical protein
MNPIPQAGPVPTPVLFVNGYLELIMLLSIVSLVVIFGMLFWTIWGVTRERLRLFCPVRLRPVRVLFRLAPDGKRVDILRCSVFGRRPISCGKVCLHQAARA